MKILVHARLSVALESPTVKEAEKLVAQRLVEHLVTNPQMYDLRVWGENGQLAVEGLPSRVRFHP